MKTTNEDIEQLAQVLHDARQEASDGDQVWAVLPDPEKEIGRQAARNFIASDWFEFAFRQAEDHGRADLYDQIAFLADYHEHAAFKAGQPKPPIVDELRALERGTRRVPVADCGCRWCRRVK